MAHSIQHLLRSGVLQPRAGMIKHGLLYLVFRGIAGLWVEPLENHVIARLTTARPSWLRDLLVPWAVVGAKMGRVVLLDIRLVVNR